MIKNQITKSIVGACAGGALALVLAATPALAADEANNPPTAQTSSTVHTSGTVTAIEKSSRTVTVKTESGEKHSFQVPSDVKGFDKLKTGDKVDADYTQSIAVAMLPPGSKLSASDKSSAMRTGMGSGVAGKQYTISAQVVSVDTVNNTVTFKGPKGQIETVAVQDPDNQAKLPNLKPGQVMQFTYTEAMAVSVTPAAK